MIKTSSRLWKSYRRHKFLMEKTLITLCADARFLYCASFRPSLWRHFFSFSIFPSFPGKEFHLSGEFSLLSGESFEAPSINWVELFPSNSSPRKNQSITEICLFMIAPPVRNLFKIARNFDRRCPVLPLAVEWGRSG